VSSTPTVLIIGGEEPGYTAGLYEQHLLRSGAAVRHMAMHDVLRSIRNDHETMFDAFERSPSGHGVDPSAFRVGDDIGDSCDGVLDVSTSTNAYGPWASAAFERAGMMQPNRAAALEVAKDKWLSYERIAAADVPAPLTRLASDETDLRMCATEMGYPVVLKHPTSSQGRDVHRVVDDASLDRAAGQIGTWPIMVQHYIECGSRDRRIVVIDGEVVDAHDRIATVPGEFRANPALGSRAERRPADDAERDVALGAAAAVGLDVCGMDMSRVTKVLPGREYLAEGQPFWIEANGTPGFHPENHGPAAVVDLLLRRLGST
jgi:RimK family alpha-L-glutamate ligase